jgi:Big-like domain-containing protein/PKD domain-containing protein
MKSMITRVRPVPASFAVLAGLAISTFACQKVPLLAPGGSILTLTTTVTALPINGSAEILAQVIEPSGTPPQRGTLITFTTTLGSIQPQQAETDTSGLVRVRFVAGGGSGTATISAISGGVASSTQNPLRILVGTAAVGSVRVSANPTLLPANGGASVITAQALDVNGNPLSSAPVSFSTTAGVIDQSFTTTDQNGFATTTLRTSTNATVTAAVGAQAGSSTPPTTGTPTTPAPPTTSGQASGSTTVNVSGAPSVLITPPATPPGEGLPANFTIAVTAAAANGSAVRDVTINWGDGTTPQSLGVVTGTATVSHIYSTAGIYRIIVTVTDSFGNVVPTSTSVTVIPVALPTINITPSVPAQAGVNGTNVTFTIQVTSPAGVNIKNAVINYGDQQTATLGGVNGTIVNSHLYAGHGAFTVSVTVEDTLGRFTTGTTSIIVP